MHAQSSEREDRYNNNNKNNKNNNYVLLQSTLRYFYFYNAIGDMFHLFRKKRSRPRLTISNIPKQYVPPQTF